METTFKDGNIKVNLLNIEKANKEDFIASALIYKGIKDIIENKESE